MAFVGSIEIINYFHVGNRNFTDGVSTTSLTFDTLSQSDRVTLKRPKNRLTFAPEYDPNSCLYPISYLNLASADNDGGLLLAISGVATAAASSLNGLDNLH